MKKKLTLIGAFLLHKTQYTLAQINIKVPISHHSNQDQIAETGINVSGSSDIWIYLVQLTNKYLRIALVVALLAIVIITGAKLMAGDNENSSKSLTNALIGILIAVFSYAIIKMIVTLF